jgi:hypothetical protein
MLASSFANTGSTSDNQSIRELHKRIKTIKIRIVSGPSPAQRSEMASSPKKIDLLDCDRLRGSHGMFEQMCVIPATRAWKCRDVMCNLKDWGLGTLSCQPSNGATD